MSKEIQHHDEVYDLLEKHFIMNLTRFCGKTSAITPENVFEFLMYLQNQGIEELQSLEGEYLCVLYNDREFLKEADILIETVEVVINQYEKAKKEKNANALAQYRRVHRLARQCFEPADTKAMIRKFMEERKRATQRKLFFDFFRPMMTYLEQYGPNDTIGAAVAHILPQLASSSPLHPASV